MIKNVLRIFSNVEVTLNVSPVCRFTNYVTTSVIGTLVALRIFSNVEVTLNVSQYK